MRFLKHTLWLPVWLLLFAGCGEQQKKDMNNIQWEEVEAIPGHFGDISKGVSAAFTGVLQGNLLVAGGCNFPLIPAVDGGEKVFYKDILMLNPIGWEKLGELPQPLAYGVTINHDDALFMIGGQNKESVSSFYRISVSENEEALIEELPSLPFSFDNGSGTFANGKFWIAGGNMDGKPSSDIWFFDPENSGQWEKAGALPLEGGLVQPVMLASGKQLYIFGGFSAATENRDAAVNMEVWTVDTASEFKLEKAAHPFPGGEENFSLSGGAGAALNDSLFLLLGGVNKTVFEEALLRINTLAQKRDQLSEEELEVMQSDAGAYLTHPVEWYNFNSSVWLYNSSTQEWKSLGLHQEAALAGAVVAASDEAVFLINGEIKPGIRTPAIRKLSWVK